MTIRSTPIRLLIRFWCGFIALLLAAVAPANAKSYVVFRYDDYAADMPGERSANPGRNAIWTAEQAVDRMFEAAGVPYVVGVIPNANPRFVASAKGRDPLTFDLDPEKTALLRRSIESGRVQLAMHGYTHTNHQPSTWRSAEFQRSEVQQVQDLLEGRAMLLRTFGLSSITTFIPPFNGWNGYTASALRETGFTILSADRHRQYRGDESLRIIPYTAQLWEIESQLERGLLPADALVVVLYHPPQIARLTGYEPRYYGLDRFAKLIERLKVRPETNIITFDQLAELDHTLTSSRYNYSAGVSAMQPFWSTLVSARWHPTGFMDTTYSSKTEYAKNFALWSLLTVLVLATTWFIGWSVFRMVARYFPTLSLCVACMILAFSTWSLYGLLRRDYHPTAPRLCAFIFAAGALVPSLKAVIRQTKTAKQA
jgi:predicted deacetylase